MPKHLKTTFSAVGLPLKLAVIILILSLAHILVMVVHYEISEIPWLVRELFDLDEEQSFGTWFSVVILLYAGYLLLLHAHAVRDTTGKMWIQWQILGIGFCFLSLDEMVGLHETLNSTIEFSWAIPGGLMAMVIGALYIPFLRRLPPHALWTFLLGGVIYVGGAVGVELATEVYADEGLLDTLEYNLTTVVEEAMEMTGVVIFIHGLLRHIAGNKGERVVLDIEVGK